MTDRIRNKEEFSYYLRHLHFPDKYTAVKQLLDHATEAEDWILAVETFRQLAAVAQDDDENERGLSFTSSVVNILFRLQREGNHPLFFEDYLAILDEEMHQDDPSSVSLTTLDLVLLLFHRDDNHEDRGASVESMCDEMVAMGLIHSKLLGSLISLITNHLKECWDDLIWLLLLLCSSPLRNPQLVPMTQSRVMVVAKEFGVDCFAKSDEEGQEQIILELLQFLEECMDNLTHPLTSEEKQPSGNDAIRSMCPLAMSSILSILVTAAEISPQLFPKYNHILLRFLDSCHELDMESVQAICKLLVLGENYNKANSRMDTMHRPANLFWHVRNLLFSDPIDNGPSSKDYTTERCARGLLLVSEMFASSALETEDVSLLWDFVRRVMLPPTNRSVNPSIGIEGLRAIRSIHHWNTRKKHQDVAIDLQLSPEIFPTMTTILMNTRLVKYSTSPDQANCKVGIELGYSKRPPCFQDNCNKQRKFHKMIFSFDALLNDPEFSSPSTWEASFRWTFDLIDTYLTLGRDKSKGKWIPHAWVEAPLEFRSTDILSNLRVMNARQQRTIDVVQGAINDFDTCTGSTTSKESLHHRDFAEVFKQMKKKSHRTILAETLLRCAMSHFLGLAMSLAILSNTYAHYNNVFVVQSSETNQQQQRLEATRLMQYQLAKIYDLVKKCEIMEAIFRGATNANLRSQKRRAITKRASVTPVGSLFETMDLHIKVQEAGEQLKSIIKTMAATQCYLQTKILWFCLVDPSHDTLLINMGQNESSSLVHTASSSLQQTSVNDYDLVINLRMNILRHLIRYLQSFSTRTQPGKPSKGPPVTLLDELADMQPFLAQCVRLAAFLSSKKGRLGTVETHETRSKNLLTLTAYYFRLILFSMEISLGFWNRDDVTSRSQPVDLGSFWSLYKCVMDSDSPLTEAIVLEETTRGSFKSILNGFLKHLLVCSDAALATELLETLSILSFGGTSNDSFTEMVRVTWTALHSTFPSTEPSFTSHVPFAFIEALKRRCPGALLSTRRTSRDAAVRETLLKAGLNKSKMMEKHFFLVDGMLRHWGFLVLAEEVSPITADYLHQLYTNIHTFLSEVNDMTIPKKSRAKVDIPADDDDDADYVPPKPVRIARPELPESSIPGLDSKNVFTYFQILLDMTVSSAALFTIKVGSQWIDPLNGPFREICKLVETFGYLVNLYRKRVHVFPQNFLSSMLNTCRSMLNVVKYQSTQSIEWRSSQPALTTEQIEADVDDPAALQFLGRILDVFGVHVVGCLTSLCESIEELSSPPSGHIGSALFGPAQYQRVKGLRLKIGKISTLLDRFAEAHRLPSPSKSVETQAKGEPSRKRRRIEIKGFLQFEESAGESEQSIIQPRAMDAGMREPNNDESKTLSSELTWDEDESEDSFGVDGDWGRESEESS